MMGNSFWSSCCFDGYSWANLDFGIHWVLEKIMQNMIKNGLTEVVEVGPGKVLQGLFKKVDRNISTSSAGLEI